MIIKFKKLHPEAKIPTKGTEHSAGFDMTCVEMETKGQYIVYKTGIAVEIPEGYCGLCFARSSIRDKPLILSNGVGLIDCDFRDGISFSFKRVSTGSNLYEIGERIGQIVIIPYPKVEFSEVNELSITKRGKGGYGSTGK
jgi:dUTP pyrophosphatase